MPNAVTEVLEMLNMDDLDRLCGLRQVRKHVTKQPRVAALAREYDDMFGKLLDDLTRQVLADLLRSQQFELRGKVVEFDNVSSLSKHQMQVALHYVFVGRWRPTDLAKGPTDALRLRVIDWGDEEEEEEEDREPDFEHAATASDLVATPTWPAFETLTAHRSEPWSSTVRHALQDFQQEAVERLFAMFVQRRAAQAARAILVLPTGGGKTRTSLQFLLDAYVTKGQRVLWVTHRRDLIDQVHAELRSLAWLTENVRSFSVSRLHGGARDLRGDIVLASASTLARQRPSRSVFEQQGKRLGIVCFDEAHHAVADSTWAALEKIVGTEVPLLSLTATPYRMEAGGQAKLDRALGPVVYTKSFAELVKRGFLARPIFVQHALESTKTLQFADVLDGKLMDRDDLSDEVVRAVARTPGRNEEIVRHWHKSAALFGKTIVFACDIDHAESLARRFAERGHPTGVVHSQLDRDSRIRQIEAFRRAKGPSLLVNVGLLTEGTNIPDTQTVLVARPTASTSLFHQMIGRGSRGEKVVPGKKIFHVIDCVDGLAAHGVHLAGQRIAAEFEIPIEDRNNVREINRAGVRVPMSSSGGAVERADPFVGRLLARGVTFSAAWLATTNRLPETIALTAAVSFEFEGAARLAPVFVETAPAVELALELLGAVIRGGRWSDAESKAHSLSEQGAFHEREWRRVIAFARRTSRAPTLLQSEWVRRDYGPERTLALVVAEHAKLSATMRDEAFLRAVQQWFEAAPKLVTIYESPEQYAADLDALSGRVTDVELARRAAADVRPSTAAANADVAPSIAASPDTATSTNTVQPLAQATEPSDDRILDAFVRVSLEVALADNELSGAERIVIGKAVDDVLRVEAGALDDATVERVSVNVSLDRACDDLCELVSWDQRSALLDWLIRVALADDRLHASEVLAIQSIATDLGIPAEDCARRLDWHDDDSPAKARVILGSTIVCAVCSAAMAMPARFCGECGVSLVTATTEPSAIAPTEPLPTCRACGTQSAMPARFCGECGAEFVSENTGSVPAVSEPAPVEAIDSRAGDVAVVGGPKATSSSEREPRDAVSAMPDFSTGKRAEDWLYTQLCTIFKESEIGRNLRDKEQRESDFLICLPTRELHIEVKHSTNVTPVVFYWSIREVEKAQLVAPSEYYLVILSPAASRARDAYDAYWSKKPLDDFLACKRELQYEWQSGYRAVDDSERWNPKPLRVVDEQADPSHYKVTFDWVELVSRRGSNTLVRCVAEDNPIAPVRDWFSSRVP
ncbi:MAG: DEAD/DEAH box helicase family protein [Myxococcales bacterium]|nr:DEAD/DEAH box helicase family protein [Myxococcales bacterium]